MNIDRKLATVQVIKDILPIKGADRIEVARIKGWKVVVKKDEFKVGDKVVYFEIDSLLPIKEDFEFLRKSSYINKEDQEGFLLRTIKLKKQISQGLIMSLDILNDTPCHVFKLVEGDDVSDYLNVTKYEVTIPDEMKADVVGPIPSFILKTNEERLQNLSDDFEEWKTEDIRFYETEKLDGQSTTMYLNNGVFGVCGRNWEYKRNPDNMIWKFVIENKIEEKLRAYGKNIAVQGELIGAGIEGNRYKLNYKTIKYFRVFNIDEYRLEDYKSFVYIVNWVLNSDTVPLICEEYKLPDTIDELLKHVEGNSKLTLNSKREGSVFKSLDSSISFKVISNQYLIG